MGDRVRVHRRGGGGRRPHRGRSHLPVHALRRNAHLGAVLHLAPRSQEDRGAGRARSRRAGQKPGGAVAGRRVAHCSQRLPIGPHPILALSHRGVRLRRPAHRARHRRHGRDGRTPGGERRRSAASPRTITTTSKPRPTCPRIGSIISRPTTSSTTRRRRRILAGLYKTFEERFFSEIVERRGYAGFGAANASIRLAPDPPRAPAGGAGLKPLSDPRCRSRALDAIHRCGRHRRNKATSHSSEQEQQETSAPIRTRSRPRPVPSPPASGARLKLLHPCNTGEKLWWQSTLP